MVPVFFYQSQPFIAPNFQQVFIGNGFLANTDHQPRPGALKTDTDSLFISSIHPDLAVGNCMTSGYGNISVMIELKGSICQLRIIDPQRMRRMIGGAKPIPFLIQIEIITTGFKSTKARGNG